MARIPTLTRLPRRDWLLLPLVVLSPAIVLALGTEATARWLMPEQREDACLLVTDTVGAYRANCVSRVKLAEGPWVENKYNECGWRSGHKCLGAAPAERRVVILGTSIAGGLWVPYTETFFGRIERRLAALCGQTVDVQNLSLAMTWQPVGYAWHLTADQTPRALALRPDAVVFVIAPYDLAEIRVLPANETALDRPGRGGFGGAALRSAWRRVRAASRAVLLFQHIVYADPQRYLPLTLLRGDGIDFLRPPFTRAWRRRLRVADAVIGRIAEQARAARVPLFVALMPSRAQAALSATPHDTMGTDPFALGAALHAVARGHGANFVDVTDFTASLADQSDLFYPVDGHPTGRGHALLAAAVQQALLADAPAFASCRKPDAPDL